jgi:hypothetical protein
MTAQELDYHEVFARLAAIDRPAAEQLLDVATMLVECDEQISERIRATGWRKDDLVMARLFLRYEGIATGLRKLHEWLLGIEGIGESEETYNGDLAFGVTGDSAPERASVH